MGTNTTGGMTPGMSSSSLVGHTRAEVGGVMGGGKNMYGDYSQVFVSPWNVKNVHVLKSAG